MASTLLLLAALSPLASAAAVGPRASVPPTTNVKYISYTTSNFPNIYRDGGGGGVINGLNFMWFSDGIYTSNNSPPKDDLSNWANFTSNSIACSNCDGKGITSFQDFGTTAKGPNQAIPYFYNNGENEGVTGIWPNNNIVTLCGGTCGVGFPQVINRTAYSLQNGKSAIYNTGVQIGLTAFGPVLSRPTQALFKLGEPMFGTFSSLAGIDGYLYMYAGITQLAAGSNGLKLARVPQTSWSNRATYQYWNGNAWSTTMPAYNDGGAANALKFEQNFFGTIYGPGAGDIFYSPLYGQYIALFIMDDPAIDPSVYMAYSANLEKGWSTPKSIYTLPAVSDGYNYGFHAHPGMDSTGKTVPIAWTAYSQTLSYRIAVANVTFS